MQTTLTATGAGVAVPDTLIHAIRDGDCIAFVGAGFSAPRSQRGRTC
jgi:hypothetical protein